MQYPGMKERVERELLAMRPFQSHFKVGGPVSFLKPCLSLHAPEVTDQTRQILSLLVNFLY